MSFRFVHGADLHLDSPLASRPAATADRLREASALAFSRLIQLCLDENVHALLLAGDTLDGERLSLATEVMFLEGLGRLAERGIKTFVATGNHDPGEPGGTMRGLAWPEGCHVFRDDSVVRIPVTDGKGVLRGTVDGVGFSTRRETRPLALALAPPSPRDVPAVALAHAQVVESRGAGAHLPYAPVHVAELEARPFDYWALGHVHLRQQVLAQPAVWYPGNLQGRHFRESGAKGALLVEIPGPGRPPRVEFRPLAPVRFETLDVAELEDVRDYQGLLDAVGRRVDRLRRRISAEDGESLCLRLRLSGPCPLVHRVEAEDLAEEVRRRWDLLEVQCDVGALHADLDMEALAQREPLVGAVRRIVARLRDGTLAPEGLSVDVLPLDVDHPDFERVLATALENMDVRIATALLEGEGGDLP